MRSRMRRLSARLMPCMVSCVLAFKAPLSSPSARARALLPLATKPVAACEKFQAKRRLCMTDSGQPDDMEGRGDLRGGKNKLRNEQVLALKRSFYSSPEPSEEIPDAEKLGGRGLAARRVAKAGTPDSLLGIIRDIPLCRWDNVMLPGFNQVLNVWMPIYTHLFESIIAQPQPWYYVHLHTPGGTDNLMNPDYALDDPASTAPRVGTLMRIQSASRTEDSRLALVVQGLMRVRVVEQTQKEPFNRATVQLFPDDEITASYYESAARLMASSPSSRDDVVSEDVVSHDVASDDVVSDDVASDHVTSLPSSRQRHDRSSWVHTLAHVAAVVSELDWQEFENANIPLTVQGGVTMTADVAALSPLSTQEGLEEQLSVNIPIRQQEAMEEALRFVNILQLAPQNLSQVLGAPVLSTTDLTANGILSHSASMPAWDGWLERGGGDTQTETATEEVEAKLWVEVDQLLRHFNRLRHGVSIPWQMLGLLPYKPPEAWPQHFRLEKAARSMAALQANIFSKRRIAPFLCKNIFPLLSADGCARSRDLWPPCRQIFKKQIL